MAPRAPSRALQGWSPLPCPQGPPPHPPPPPPLPPSPAPPPTGQSGPPTEIRHSRSASVRPSSGTSRPVGHHVRRSPRDRARGQLAVPGPLRVRGRGRAARAGRGAPRMGWDASGGSLRYAPASSSAPPLPTNQTRCVIHCTGGETEPRGAKVTCTVTQLDGPHHGHLPGPLAATRP